MKNHSAPRALAVLVLTTGMMLLLIAALVRTWRMFYLVQFPLIVLGAGFIGYAVTFGALPGETLAMVLLTSSWEKVKGALLLWRENWLAVLGCTLAVGYVVLATQCPRTPIFSPRVRMLARVMLALAVPATVYAALDPDQTVDGLSMNPVLGSLMFLGTQVPVVRSDLDGSRIVKQPYHASRRGGEEVHILVIGESSRRNSWSVYGYGRQTTPYLSRLQNDAIFLLNAVADSNVTAWSVPMMLTGMRPGTFKFSDVHGNLLDLAHEAHYRTSWLVNQNLLVSFSVGIKPDNLQVASASGSVLDEQLLSALRRELARSGESRFIGLHITGSHWEYARRYPPQFRRFGSSPELRASPLSGPGQGREVLDTYDNSVLYTDWFLEQVVEAARKVQVPATVAFMPDHGEDLFVLDGHTGHAGPDYTPHAFDIPAFIWTNEAYRRAHPQITEALRANARKRVRGHNLFYTMADIMGISWPGAHANESFATSAFTPDLTTPYIAGGNLVHAP